MKITPQQLEKAKSKGGTKWLEDYIAQNLPALFLPSTDYQVWFNDLIQALESRSLSQPKQQKNRITDVRNAIKVIDPNHPALEVVEIDTPTWIEINDSDRERIAHRTTKLIHDPDAVVALAIDLIKTNNWSDIAAGLAVLTGRRCAEVLKTAVFEDKSQYTLTFTGSLKRRDEPVKLVFVIPVLCEAHLIIKAIDNLRLQLGAKVNNSSVRQINKTYEARVADKCDRYFSHLVPTRDGEDNLYTHLFKSVYSAIACHWYCPVTVPEMEFASAIQGHYKLLQKPDGKLQRSITSNRNYGDYRIADGSGNIDGRLGIKLGLPGVEVIDQFQLQIYQTARGKIIEIQSRHSTQQSSSKPSIKFQHHQLHQPQPSMNEKSNSSINEAVVSLSVSLSRLETIAHQLNLSHSEAINSLVDWAEAGVHLAQHFNLKNPTPEALTLRVQELDQNYTNLQHHSTPLSPQSVPDNNISSWGEIEQRPHLLSTISSLSHSVEFLSRLLATNAHSLPSVTDNDNSHSSLINHEQNTKSSLSTESSSQSNSHNLDRKTVSNSSSSRKVSTENRARDTAQVMTEDINHAIDAIIEFNNTPHRPHQQKFYVSANAISDLTQRSTSSVSKVVKERMQEVNSHHDQHQLDKYHNRSRQDDDGHDYPPIQDEPDIHYTKITEISEKL